MTADPVPPWSAWFWLNLKSLAAMYFIVFFLIIMMAAMNRIPDNRIGLIKIISKLLHPLLRLAGVGLKAAIITIVGMIMGLACGGGLIIAESRSGSIPKSDIFGSITLMNLGHSLAEDTIVLAALGGSLWGLLGGRLAFAAALTGLIVRLAQKPAFQSFLIDRKYV
jgi:hypothetical protein